MLKFFIVLIFIFLLFILGITLILKRIKRFMTNLFGININPSSKVNYNNQDFAGNFGQNFQNDSTQNSNNQTNNSTDEIVYKKDDIIVMKGNKNK